MNSRTWSSIWRSLITIRSLNRGLKLTIRWKTIGNDWFARLDRKGSYSLSKRYQRGVLNSDSWTNKLIIGQNRRMFKICNLNFSNFRS